MPMMGAILCPVGLFWFAWYSRFNDILSRHQTDLVSPRTSLPPTHWIVPILGGFPFGTGIAQIMQGLVQYIMDTYTIYCASAIASTVVLRSAMAAVFPLISPTMYANLGPQWAASVFAFLSLACAPLPFLFYVSSLAFCFTLSLNWWNVLQKYGPVIRSKSRFASSHMGGATLIASPLETLQEKGHRMEISSHKGH